jgi:ferredoxin--NADP+ reductase
MSDPVFPDVQIKLVRPLHPVVGRVVSNDPCMNGKSASFVKHTVFDVSGTPLAGNFHAGQSFGVVAPGLDDRGKPHKVRLYSVACPSWGEDGEGNLVSTTPKRVVDEFSPQSAKDDATDHHLFLGVCSNYLCDLNVGDEVQLSGPNGKRFLLPTDMDAHDYLFLATGTGIAPFRGMLMELLENPSGSSAAQIHLVMGSPYTTDLLYHDLLLRLAESHENFHYHTAISREDAGDGGGRYVDGLLDDGMDTFAGLLSNQRTLIYLCGLDGMRIGLFRTLAAHGLDGGYLSIDPALVGRSPGDWSAADIKRGIKPTGRCLIEVY